MTESSIVINIRHLGLMQEALEQWNGSKVKELGRLVRQLEALNGSMIDTTKDWDEQFEKRWMLLEEVYAIALDRGSEEIDRLEGNLVHDAILGLLNLVRAKIAK